MCEVVRPEPWAPVKQMHAIEVLRKLAINITYLYNQYIYTRTYVYV